MRLRIHFTVSLVIGLIFGLIFKSYLIGTATWLFGWLVDCDHLLDYFLYLIKFKRRPSIKEFFSGAFFKKSCRVYVLAHSWEELIFLIIFGSFILSWQLAMAISFSYFLHLAIDQYAYKANPLIYFLIYRIKSGFKTAALCRN